MLLNLATFVRSTLTGEPPGTIALREEIELQRLYLDIEQARFGDRLQVEIDFPTSSPEPVPALILQPLVENAVRHGVSRSEDQLSVRIAAAATDRLSNSSSRMTGKAEAPAPARRRPRRRPRQRARAAPRPLSARRGIARRRAAGRRRLPRGPRLAASRLPMAGLRALLVDDEPLAIRRLPRSLGGSRGSR